MPVYNTIVVKVGTNVLTRPDGLLDHTNISHLVDQIAALKNQGVQVILVSSGAVGAGKSLMPATKGLSKVVQRQVFSAVGQVRLMETYRQLFYNYNLFCAQLLVTKEDFRDRSHYLNMKQCFHALLRDDIIPIVNENDVVAVSELMFTDNDELAGLVASMINADALVILSSVDGLLDGHPEDPKSKVIANIDPAQKKWQNYILPSRSSFGRGGMTTKYRIAQKAAKVGIATYIANGRRSDILINILANDFIGTRFNPKPVVSNLKKWIAYNELEKKGRVLINAGAEEAICSPDKVSSLLLVGITAIEGDFQKGDLVLIVNEKETQIGVGIAQYSAVYAKQHLGQKGKKPLIHYDYMYVEGPHDAID